MIDQNIAIGQKEDALPGLRLPESPDNLKGGEGLAGARGHDQQEALLPLGNGFDGLVDGDELVVTGSFVAAVAVVVLGDDGVLLAVKTAMGSPHAPERCRIGKFIQGQLPLNRSILGDLVVEEKAVSIGTENKRNLQHLGISQCLLHAVAKAVAVVLGLNNRDGDIGLIEEHVVSPLVPGAGMELTTHNHPTLGEGELFPDLGGNIPARLLQCRRDELGADIAFGELLLVHRLTSLALPCIENPRKCNIQSYLLVVLFRER